MRTRQIEKTTWLAGATIGFGAAFLSIPVAFLFGQESASHLLASGFAMGTLLLLVAMGAAYKAQPTSAMD